MNAAKLTRDQLKVRQMKAKRALEAQRRQVLICAGTGCIAGGSLNIYDKLKEECQRRGLNVHVGLLREDETPETKSDDINLKRSGCHGFCEDGLPCSRSSPTAFSTPTYRWRTATTSSSRLCCGAR